MESEAAKPLLAKPKKYDFQFYRPLPRYWTWDGLPWVGAYAAVLASIATATWQQGELNTDHFVWCVPPAALHILLFLATEWSVKARCYAHYRRVSSIDAATHVCVLPLVGTTHKHYPMLLVPLEKEGSDYSIQYQKKRFLYSPELGTFERLRFDLQAPLEQYASSVGLSTEDVPLTKRRYGSNVYDIPLPTFGELFKEHAVAPFFVFQLFCVMLWLMDEYWYYALLTLFMLILLEAQTVQRRRHDLGELRGMRIPPRHVQVYRDKTWKIILSDTLLPGDLLAVCRAPDDTFPCDVLLLQGSVLANEAMLTGESVPQMKVCLPFGPGDEELKQPLDMKGLHKQHIVNAGTTIMLHQNNSASGSSIKHVPMVGGSPVAVGYVLRTGFDTTQGKLCRTILFSTERVTVQSSEAYRFILILLIFAIAACCYVLYDGLVVAPTRSEESPRSTFKLFLSVSHIITSVVPPEFPIMLSLAVNLSLVAMVKRRIYCTEPFRVPLAGRIDTCCFDKTGTLTSDSMQVKGIHGLESSPPQSDEGPTLNQELPFMTTAVMAACSGLTYIDREVVGDPLEKAALQAVNWILEKPDEVSSKRGGKGVDTLNVLLRFPFASELQRMAVVVHHTGPGLGWKAPIDHTSKEFDRKLVLVKGSCEALKPRLKEVPSNLDALLLNMTREGYRVLCLAGKELPKKLEGKVTSRLPRAELECDLEFAGLLALKNEIKPQTSSTIRKLRASYHRVVMITGDNPMTACQVAIQVDISDGKFLLLERAAGTENGDASTGKSANEPSAASSTEPTKSSSRSSCGGAALEWRSLEDSSKTPKPFNLDKIKDLSRKHGLCIPGRSLALLSQQELDLVAPFVTVYARVSPQQKEQVVTALNKVSHTVMVGDGTNDVGALKHAHVGISLMTAAPTPMRYSASAAARRRNETHYEDERVPMVQLGDASIASPFTYKGDSIRCSLDVLRGGRATLSTVIMMYKIMGLNSVVSAFAMSVLTLDGVKLGDGQTAMESLFGSVLFFMVSRSTPAKDLAKIRPTGSIFAWHALLPLALQLVIHCCVLCWGWLLATSYRPADYKRDLEGDFEPNLTNSVVFVLIAAMHCSSFLANYEGAPFMTSLRSNKPLFYMLSLFVLLIAATGFEVLPELNMGLSLVPFPNDDFRRQILILLAIDLLLPLVVSFTISSIATRLAMAAAERHAKDWNLTPAEASKPSKKREKNRE